MQQKAQQVQEAESEATAEEKKAENKKEEAAKVGHTPPAYHHWITVHCVSG